MLATRNPDLDAAVVRFVERVDMDAVDEIVDSVPEEAFGTVIMPEGMRSSHKKLLHVRYEEGMLPAYERAKRRAASSSVELARGMRGLR